MLYINNETVKCLTVITTYLVNLHVRLTNINLTLFELVIVCV